MKTFQITGDHFTYGAEPVQLISGAVHYFRTVPEHWEARLLALKACGLNCVETYVPWNAHEPAPGEYQFTGMLDLISFIEIAQSLDLLVIVRPSPYICAEWEFGGLPAWLLADPGIQLRCSYPPYLQAIERYYDVLLPMLVPLQCTQGGPIIAMQIENEYGSYGNDKNYLRFLEDSLRTRGVDVMLFTSDGPTDACLQGGTLPHIFKTTNFGSKPLPHFELARQYQTDGPMMCMEFWNGWFDHWGAPHHTRNAQDAAHALDEMLASGASVNFYMFHGGTNFGFFNGANCGKKADGTDNYEPDVTSYDYDAPLDEAGDPTPKYDAFRNVIGKYRALPDLPRPKPSVKTAYGQVALTEQVGLFGSLDAISQSLRRATPEPMEMLGQDYGFILYRTFIPGPRPTEMLFLQDVHDRALIFANGELLAIKYRNDAREELRLEIPAQGVQLDILVENMGRVNYGPYMIDRKGITEGVRLGNQFLFDWEIFCLPLSDLSALTFGSVTSTTLPAFYRGTFNVDEPNDTFLALPNWTKGVCFINGFNLGRYWNQEPYRHLYVPGPLLKSGANELVIFELHGVCEPVADFRSGPYD